MKCRILRIVPFAALCACAPVDDSGNADADEPEAAASNEAPDESAINWTGYRAGGNEPFWNLTIGDERIEFDHFDRPDADGPRPEPVRTANGWRFATRAEDGQPLVLEIENTVCHDSMSGAPFPDSVTVTVQGETYTGCGGDTASLLAGGEWRVVSLEGEELPHSFEQTLHFDAEGGLSGNGGCNRFSASYEINGPEFSLGPIRSTRRACTEAEGNRLEVDFFTLLGETTRFTVSEDGTLQLFDAGDEPAVAARR